MSARLGRLVTLFEGSGMYGGQIATTSEVDGLTLPGKYSGQDLAIHLLEDARSGGVDSFLGIPYAAPPVGERKVEAVEPV